METQQKSFSGSSAEVRKAKREFIRSILWVIVPLALAIVGFALYFYRH